MKILYFYQYFSTPKGAWGTRIYEFAKEWSEQGHEVTVVTSIYNKSDLKATKFIEDQFFDGIQVKVINVKLDNRASFVKRLSSFFKYSIVASYFALKLPADVVVASSGPITVGLPGLVARYFRGRKLVFETRDLWPEGAIELGIIKNPVIKKMAYWFEARCYKASSYIITLSTGMTKNIKDRFGIQNIIDVTNAANIELFTTKKEFKCSYLTPKEFAIYTGNIGMVNNSFWLYKAAIELKKLGREDIKIVLIGEGQQRKELEGLVKTEKLTNFLILNLMPKNELVSYVQNAIVSLVPLNGSPVLDTSSPNKFFESLAAGVPVIQNTQGWMKDFIKKHSIGYTIDPNDSFHLAHTLIQMKDNPEEVNLMGERGALIAKKYFDKKFLANKMLDILKRVDNDSN